MDENEGWDRVAAVIRSVTRDAATMGEKSATLGVSGPTVRKLEAGEPVVHPKAVGALTRTLGWPIDALDTIRSGGPAPKVRRLRRVEPSESDEIHARLAAIEERVARMEVGATGGSQRHLTAAEKGGDPGPEPKGKRGRGRPSPPGES